MDSGAGTFLGPVHPIGRYGVLVKVTGHFAAIAGNGRIAADGSVSGRLVIAAASLRTGIRRRDEHLHSPDFFDTKRFRDIVVDVSAATAIGDHSASLVASLNVRGVTRPLARRPP